MKKLRPLLLLLFALFLLAACNDDDDKQSTFYFDSGELDSNENTNDREFGIYKWDLALLRRVMDNYVIVVPYNEVKRELIFSGQASLELTIQDSTYYADPIYLHEDYEEYALHFVVTGFHDVDESYTLKYIQGDDEISYSITIPYVNYLTRFSYTDVSENEPVMTFDWELAADNHYQLLSAQHTNGWEGWDDELYPYFCQRINKSAREYTFSEEYNYNPNWGINFYSIAEVKQNQTSDLIGISIVNYALNFDGVENDGQGYNKKEIRAIVDFQFKNLHKAIVKNIRLNN